MSKEATEPKEYPLTKSRRFPPVPKNVSNASKSTKKHRELEPIRHWIPTQDDIAPDQNLKCNDNRIPYQIKQFIASLARIGIQCVGVVKKGTGAFVIRTNTSDDYVISVDGGIIKRNKRNVKKSRKAKKSRKNKK